MNPLDIKKDLLKQIIDMADEQMLAKIKPGKAVPEEARSEEIDIAAMAPEAEMSEPGMPESPVGEEDEMDDEMLQQLIQMSGDKPEEEEEEI